MHRTRNAAYSQGYRGFESRPLRHWIAATQDSEDLLHTDARLKEHLGWHAEQDLSHRLEVRAAGLDLLRQRVHVAKATLERAAREYPVDTRGLVGEIGHLDCAMDSIGARKAHPRTIGDADRIDVVRQCVDRGQRVEQIS